MPNWPTDTQTDRETDRQADGQTERQTESDFIGPSTERGSNNWSLYTY